MNIINCWKRNETKNTRSNHNHHHHGSNHGGGNCNSISDIQRNILNYIQMELTVTGKIKMIEPIKQISDKFSVRMFVLTVPNGEYPQDISFQLAQDKCKMLDNYSPGIDITVKFNLRGREYNGKYYNTLDVWSINSMPVVDESFDDSPF